MPPAGLSKSTAVPSSMSTSSSAFMARITVRLLSRSASTPPGRLKRISGISRMIWASAALSCDAVHWPSTDHQQHDDLLPGVVVERPEGLRDQQAHQRMLARWRPLGDLSFGQHGKISRNPTRPDPAVPMLSHQAGGDTSWYPGSSEAHLPDQQRGIKPITSTRGS